MAVTFQFQPSALAQGLQAFVSGLAAKRRESDIISQQQQFQARQQTAGDISQTTRQLISQRFQEQQQERQFQNVLGSQFNQFALKSFGITGSDLDRFAAQRGIGRMEAVDILEQQQFWQDTQNKLAADAAEKQAAGWTYDYHPRVAGRVRDLDNQAYGTVQSVMENEMSAEEARGQLDQINQELRQYKKVWNPPPGPPPPKTQEEWLREHRGFVFDDGRIGIVEANGNVKIVNPPKTTDPQLKLSDLMELRRQAQGEYLLLPEEERSAVSQADFTQRFIGEALDALRAAQITTDPTPRIAPQQGQVGQAPPSPIPQTGQTGPRFQEESEFLPQEVERLQSQSQQRQVEAQQAQVKEAEVELLNIANALVGPSVQKPPGTSRATAPKIGLQEGVETVDQALKVIAGNVQASQQAKPFVRTLLNDIRRRHPDPSDVPFAFVERLRLLDAVIGKAK